MYIRDAVPTDIPTIARIHVESWRSTYSGIVAQATLDALDVEARRREWQQTFTSLSAGQFVLVALANEAVVGFAAGGPARDGLPGYPGEVYAIYLLASHQGQGLGRRLVAAAAQRLLAQGITAMVIWALADNPACAFYTRLGGQVLRRSRYRLHSEELDDVAFGWADLQSLATDVS